MDGINVLIRLALYLDLTLLFGLPCFALYALRGGERGSAIAMRYVRVTGIAALIGIPLSLGAMAIMAKAMSGAAEYAQIESHVYEMMVTGTDFGMAWAVRLAALLIVLLAIPALRRRPTLRFGVLTAAAGVALSTLAWGGHGAMTEGSQRYLHLAADIVHLLAAGAWVGALAAFVLLAARRTRQATDNVVLLGSTADGFARVGTLIVATLVVTGVINYWLTAGPTLDGLVSTAYGGLLLAKLGVFGTMLGLAALNRYRLSPRLAAALAAGDHEAAASALHRSLLIESGCAALVLALVAWLGVLSPAPM